MQEDFLHYIWKYKKFDLHKAITTAGEPITLISTGAPNFNSGPDFFNGIIKIGAELWAGNVEIHIKSSDWYAHGHEKDPAYDNVVLHVVWEEDVEIFRNDNSTIPTLELKHLVPEKTKESYRQLLLAPNRNWINCEKDLEQFDSFIVENWLERLFLERLQEKSTRIEKMLQHTGNNWEAVLFQLLAKNFGLKVNGSAFLSMARSIDFKTVQKCRESLVLLEALLLGQAGILEKKIENAYYNELQREYSFLKTKYKLKNDYVERPKFFRLRPDNFPTIRLSQLAALYSSRQHLFSEVIKAGSRNVLQEIFRIEASDFWKTHYTFEKEHPGRSKKLTDSFIDLLLINTIIPLQFSYLKHTGKDDPSQVLNLIQEIKAEKNTVINKFNKIRPKIALSAMQSQALLHMKTAYCDKNACLNCAIGSKLIQGQHS